MGTAKTRAANRYKARNYKRVGLDLRPDEYTTIQRGADEAGLSVSGFIRAAALRAAGAEAAAAAIYDALRIAEQFRPGADRADDPDDVPG